MSVLLAQRLSRSLCSNSLHPIISRHGSTSSKIWIDRQSRDPFVKQRNEDSFRARSAYKLEEIDQKFRILRSTSVVVDLGAAPGGWSEYVAHAFKRYPPKVELNQAKAPKAPMIIAVDLLPIEPIPGVVTIKGNFLSREVYERIHAQLHTREVDVILSDMCANASGNRASDISNSLELCSAALIFAQRQFASSVPRGPGKGSPKTLM